MELIRKLPEPLRLLLAWQSPRPNSSRRRWEVGELVRPDATNDAPVSLRYFDTDKLAGAIGEGFDGYPAFARRPGEMENVLETFMRRLPPRRRSDFPRYLNSIGISEDAEFTDFALLGASEAKLPSDGFSIVNPLDDSRGEVQLISEVVGYRHLSDRALPEVGDSVNFRFEPGNPHDPNAIQVFRNNDALGWVNRLQTNAFRRWIDADDIEAKVWRVNGSVDYPRLFMRVTANRLSSA